MFFGTHITALTNLTPGVGIKAGHFKAEVGFNIQRIVDVVNVNANALKLAVGYIF